MRLPVRRKTTTTINITSMQCRILVTIFLVISVGLNVHFFMKHSESPPVSSVLLPGGNVITPLSSSTSSTSETIHKKKKKKNVVVNDRPKQQLGGGHGDELSSSSREASASSFPDKPPRERFPNMDKCKVIFRDSTMATCHMGAYGGTLLRVFSLLCVCVCVCVPTFVAFDVNRSTNFYFHSFSQIR